MTRLAGTCILYHMLRVCQELAPEQRQTGIITCNYVCNMEGGLTFLGCPIIVMVINNVRTLIVALRIEYGVKVTKQIFIWKKTRQPLIQEFRE